jgi:glycosyltransferase involved in cell wall biosynthesis
MNKNLLVIGFVWPEPNSTAAGSRMMQLIELFIANNYKVTFVSSASKNKNSYNLKELNIQCSEILLNDSSFDILLKKINPKIVLFDRFFTEEQFGWRVTEICPRAIRILDTEDLHFLRDARKTAHKDKVPLSQNDLMNDLAKREIASIYRCDVSLIISKYELKLLKNAFKMPKSILKYVPFLMNKIELSTLKAYPSFTERAHFISIGNFKHEPNWHSVLYLKKHIWPIISKKLPQSQMHIYGAYASERIRNLHNDKENFLIKGWAPNKKDAFKNARVCLAPIQFGAGLKGKLIDAMQYGTPSVTTSIGAEAMHNSLPWNGFIEDSIEKFAEKSVNLYTDEGCWHAAQQFGVNIINKCYSKGKYGGELLKYIEKIQESIEQHRLNNFTGAMLGHHTIKSTKYMAKWIEEKNK